MNTDLLCVPLLCNLFLTSSMHLHVNAVSLCGVHVCILCLLILFTRVHILCALPLHIAYPMSVHVLCMVWTFRAWCGRSVHGVHVPCMVCTFCAWMQSLRSISTSQARFQPLYIYMCMYIEVAVCQFIYYPTTSV